jgi:processive 1,2-diacylglycerol beta-glucosyltransferase
MALNQSLLFLYMVPGTGHQHAAEAIMEAASHMDPSKICVGVDSGSQAFPLLGKMINRLYMQMLKRAPFIWEYLYDNPDVEEATRDARDLVILLGSRKMKAMLKKHKPVVVVCTQAAPAMAMAVEIRSGRLRVPHVGVFTDFGVHTYWLQPEIDLYLVGHEDVKQEMIRRGIDASRIHVTGIPIRTKFGETTAAATARQRLKLHPTKRTLLLMGGGHGLGPMPDIVHSLKTLPFPFQAMIVCGRNRSVYRKVMKAVDGSPDFHVHGFVKDTALLMSAADLLITKPGGLTCSEALAKQLPLVLTTPIPGQEERNVRFLTKHNAARLAQTPEDLLHIVMDLLRHPKKIEAMRQRARALGKPHAAWEAARLIFDAGLHRGLFDKRAHARA